MNTDGAVRRIGDRDTQLWVAAVLLYGVGDTVATLWGLSTPNVAEGGPIAGPALTAFGPLGLIGLKCIVLAAFYLVWRSVRTPGRVALPLALAVTGVVVTGWNLLIINTA
jgi:hypothetical protein